jgi:hypothetical protein
MDVSPLLAHLIKKEIPAGVFSKIEERISELKKIKSPQI